MIFNGSNLNGSTLNGESNYISYGLLGKANFLLVSNNTFEVSVNGFNTLSSFSLNDIASLFIETNLFSTQSNILVYSSDTNIKVNSELFAVAVFNTSSNNSIEVSVNISGVPCKFLFNNTSTFNVESILQGILTSYNFNSVSKIYNFGTGRAEYTFKYDQIIPRFKYDQLPYRFKVQKF